MTRFCNSCGHQLTVGRYCTNCGARVTPLPVDVAPQDGDHATAPVPGPPPSSARYPLYADNPSPAPVAPPVPAAPAPATPPSYDAVAPSDVAGTRRRSALPWLIGLLALVTIVLVGGALLLLAPSGGDDADDPTRGGNQANGGETSDDGRGGDGGDGLADGAESVLAPAEVDVPATATASVDEDGDPVTFKAANLLDGDPRTCWRMPGDGSGSVVTFGFDEAVTVTRVGLINGYAKTDPPHDWYDGNRRIVAVVWVFDDGTEVSQELGDDRAMQSIPVDAIETRTLELRIREVTGPGDGPDARDFTAISEVEVAGSE